MPVVQIASACTGRSPNPSTFAASYKPADHGAPNGPDPDPLDGLPMRPSLVPVISLGVGRYWSNGAEEHRRCQTIR